jgi:hypothetical protein
MPHLHISHVFLQLSCPLLQVLVLLQQLLPLPPDTSQLLHRRSEPISSISTL